MPDGSDVRQIQDAFNLAWKLVAALRGTPGQLAELTVLNASIGELADDPDPSVRAHQYRVLNRQFHAIVHTMAHSPVVAEISRRV